jgi:membrane fusion protein (multidrug efflux system)
MNISRIANSRIWEFIAVSLALLALAGSSGCRRSDSSLAAPEPAAPVPVQTAPLKRGAITRNLTLPAEVKPYQQTVLYAKVAGYLKTIAVDKGDRVKEGDLLAELEVPEMLADLARYQTELEVAALDFKRLNESLQKAPDLVVPQTVDNARGKVDIAKASLDRTQTLLSFAKLTAPFSGTITRRMVDPGAFIPAATSGSTPQNAAILTLTDFTKVRVQVAVPEIEASFVQTGQPIRLVTEDLPGRAFEGTVTRFSWAIDDASKTMLAEIELPNPNLELRPGMYALVRIGIQRKEDALLAPAEALLVEKTGAFVFTLAGSQAKRAKVQTGFNDGVNVEIVSGLNPDQSVILIGKKTLGDGQPVTVTEGK